MPTNELVSPETREASLDWLHPNHQPAPPDALHRIRLICEQPGTELFPALLTVVATHQAVPRNILAVAVKQFRRDCDGLSQDDVMGLLTAVRNGGFQGFESVLRTRRNGERKPAALSWVRDDI